MRVASHARSDRGRVRDQNEDSFFADDALGLYAVADGVGGQVAGEVASALAIEAVARHVRAWVDAGRRGGLMDVAQEAVTAACSAVYERGRDVPRLRGMATTLLVVLVDGARAVMAHVGDSRLYLVRDGRCDQLSADHTVAAELVRQGLVETAQLETHRFSHVLTRSIGLQPTVLADTLSLQLLQDDLLILASDGLDAVAKDPAEMLARLGPELEASAKGLIDAANERGGRDNITVVLVRRVGPVDEVDQNLPALLEAVAIFSNISTSGLLRLISAAELRELDGGERLFEAGQPADALVVVLAGELRWTLGAASRALGPGDCAGISAVLRPADSPGTLEALGPSRVLWLSAARLELLLRRRRRLGAAITRGIAGVLADIVVRAPDEDPRLHGF